MISQLGQKEVLGRGTRVIFLENKVRYMFCMYFVYVRREQTTLLCGLIGLHAS